MRIISLIVIHCSAVRPDQNSSAAQIDTWHRQRGFHLGIGYHYVVRRNDRCPLREPQRPLDRRLLRGRAQRPRSTRRHPHTRAEVSTPGPPQGSPPPLPAGPHRRSPRPQPSQGLPLHRERRPRVRRPAAQVNERIPHKRGILFCWDTIKSPSCDKIIKPKCG